MDNTRMWGICVVMQKLHKYDGLREMLYGAEESRSGYIPD